MNKTTTRKTQITRCILRLVLVTALSLIAFAGFALNSIPQVFFFACSLMAGLGLYLDMTQLITNTEEEVRNTDRTAIHTQGGAFQA